MNILLIAGAALVFVAAVIHLMIFFLESVVWRRPSTWKRFGLRTQEDAEVVRPMAFNQGFYNLFLAVGAGTGLVLLGSASLQQAGLALMIFAGASMVAAATVLIVSSPRLARAAIIQGAAPLLGVTLLLVRIATA